MSVLSSNRIAVHYLPAPKANENLINSEIEDTVSWMQAAVELGRIIRTRTNLPLKAPLREAIVIHPDPAVRREIMSAQMYIVEELNVRILTVTDDKHKYGVQLRGQLNHRTLGVCLKKDYKAVVEAVKSMPTADLEKFVATGSITVCGHELSGNDLTVVYTTGGKQKETPDATEETRGKTGKGKNKKAIDTSAESNATKEGTQRYEAASDARGLLVLLDTTPDEELEHERLARELINRIQRTRKKAELVPEDSIVIIVATDSPELQRIACPTSPLTGLIQATVKQPINVISHRVTAVGDQPLSKTVITAAESVLPADWSLGKEIIRETVSLLQFNNSKQIGQGIKLLCGTKSKTPDCTTDLGSVNAAFIHPSSDAIPTFVLDDAIPPDDLELILFARYDSSAPVIEPHRVAGSVVQTSASQLGSSSMTGCGIVTVRHDGSKRECIVTLEQPKGTLVVSDS
ncbi:unnamed protein product, partial [Echinostoma caproni]|uniref:tRNA acetyltransferase TAN1 n=1 Tax=Echinostoma caproni TaxID=27848 RepID=A0A183BBV4_9TREM